MRKPAADKLIQRVGVAVVTGAVLLSQVPAQAIASEAGSSAAPQTASQASAQSEPQQQSDSANPPEPPPAASRPTAAAETSPSTVARSRSRARAPIVYSTGDIEVSDVTGTASESQLVGMEGLKTVLIPNSTLSSSQTGKTASDPVADGVIIYQSTSGDAESTTGEAATFQAVDSKLSSAIQSDSMFYLTNTSADVVLKNTELDFASSAARLLYAAGNDANNWGQAGSNGATVKFTGIGQQLAGDVVADTISSVDLHLTEGTTWAGAASIEQNAAGSTSDAPMTVNIDGSSQWTVTADSTVSSLNVAEGAKVVDADGKTVTIVAGGQTVVQGDSGLTVTVTGSYSTDYDASEAGSLTSEAIDRTAYDDAFGTDVDDASSDEKDATSQASTASDTDSGSSSDAEKGFFAQVVDWLKSLFGM